MQEHDLALVRKVGLELSTISDDRTSEGYGTLNTKLGIHEEDIAQLLYIWSTCLILKHFVTCGKRTGRAQVQTHSLFSAREILNRISKTDG